MGNICGRPSRSDDRPKFKFHNGYKTSDELDNFNDFFLPENKSCCKQFLTKDIWNEYKDQKCDKGVPFKAMVFSGIANQTASIGVYAGSHNAYKKFNKMFDKVIE